ncbi:hypothetical protein [Desulfovibrio inopinatus]|uniref:hypothetical protein n=1 Tax=Desulfovibrio inopinatus TaxID=102109 RepID=UPI00040BFF0D|nr:hypothetical protein [Desulfovibrio inopinatus]
MTKKFLFRGRTGLNALILFLSSILFLSGCAGVRGLGSHTNQTVFVYEGQAHRVCVRGDFNGWSGDADCLKREGNTWTLSLQIPAGRYAYVLSLNDNQCIPDPQALLFEDDGFGNTNSVLIVP